MSSALQFVRTPSGLSILLGFKPHTIASTDAHFEAVMALVKEGASEEAVLAVIEATLTSNVSETPVVEFVVDVRVEAVDEQGGDSDEPVLVLTGLNPIRGGYAGQTPDGDFDVYAEGEYLTSFDSLESALDYVAVIQHRYDEVAVKNADGRVVARFVDAVLQVSSETEATGVAAGADSEEEENHYFVRNDAGEAIDSFVTMEEARDFAQVHANEYESDVIITNWDGDFLEGVQSETKSDDEIEEAAFDVYGDDAYLEKFSTQSQAVDYANSRRAEFKRLDVINSGVFMDDIPVETIEGFLDTFLVLTDGHEQERFDSLPAAKGAAISFFGIDAYSRVVVQDADGQEVVVLEG